MRFILDESAEVKIGAFLESQGYDVKVVQRDFAVGLPDHEVLRLAHAEQRILITNDRDFGDLVFRQGMPHSGVIYLRFPLDSAADQKIASIGELLSTRVSDIGKFIVLTPRGLRVGDENT
jgi:predicted nuclease of predicted toxin-antitoxin system